MEQNSVKSPWENFSGDEIDDLNPTHTAVYGYTAFGKSVLVGDLLMELALASSSIHAPETLIPQQEDSED